MLVTISCIVISITAVSVTKKPEKKAEKNRAKLWQHYVLIFGNLAAWALIFMFRLMYRLRKCSWKSQKVAEEARLQCFLHCRTP
jgi:hypothetical protein